MKIARRRKDRAVVLYPRAAAGLAAILLGLALPAAAAPAKKSPARPAAPAPVLKAIETAPAAVKLLGARSEQGLIVTGRYSDGSVRDVTPSARLAVSRAGVVAAAAEDGRRVLRPQADGSAVVTVTVPGAPAPARVPVVVEQFDRPAPVSFRNEVIPALTKAGCSQGTCHGTPTGKGGFKLSLQGYAPELDFASIVGEGGGRRVNKTDPGRSLLLLKPMAEMPHGGGKRLSPDMPEFAVLSRWIGEGLRDDPPGAPQLERVEILPGRRTLTLPHGKQQVAAIAHFADGSARDVTSLAKLSTSDEDRATVTREGLVEAQERGEIAVVVRYQHALESLRITFLKNVPGFTWSNPPETNFVDRHVFARLKLFQIPPSGLSGDAEFLRRAYLDTVGILPTPDEARAFFADRAPDRRSRLIRALTERPEFADFWALKWADVLRIQDETMQEQGARAYHGWVRDSLAANKPVDQFVREILTAAGPTFSTPPANFYRGLGGASPPDELSQATAQLFLGVRMACAKCHNHPFERWTQDEYYQLAAFFSQVRTRGSSNRSEATVFLDPEGEVTHLRTGKVMRPKLLGAEFASVPAGGDRRMALAEWMTRKDNPFFARAIVNRVWANLLGRGIVEPIDDFRASNPPVNEELLDALARDFVSHGFDMRHLVRTIMESRTYQLTARTLPLNKSDETYFSHALTRLLSAEQLADSISQFTGVPDEFAGYPKGTRAAQLAGTRARTPFLKTFGRPDRNLNCECEREKDATLFQALKLIGDRAIHAKLSGDTGRVARLSAPEVPVEKAVEELYLAALTRPPVEREKRELVAYVTRAPARRAALEDLAWALINSKEFLFRH